MATTTRTRRPKRKGIPKTQLGKDGESYVELSPTGMLELHEYEDVVVFNKAEANELLDLLLAAREEGSL